MIRAFPLVLIMAGALAALGPNWVGAQVPPVAAQGQAQVPQGPPIETTLVFDREVFTYPRFERKDPFFPLVNQDDSGPRFEEIQLTGVIFSPNPDLSVALFGPRGESGEGRIAQTYRVRRGDRIGNVRILEIQLTRVVVSVDEFGETQTHVLELQRPGGGGIS